MIKREDPMRTVADCEAVFPRRQVTTGRRRISGSAVCAVATAAASTDAAVLTVPTTPITLKAAHPCQRNSEAAGQGTKKETHARPFLKWAGSKRFLLPTLSSLVPPGFGVYHEPFLGSAALFFELQPSRAFLSDACAELVDTYTAVRDNPRAVLRNLTALTPTRDQYYVVREHRSRGRFKRAAEFIYLNKSCWNGLYRVNAKGEFNVPYGRPTWRQAVVPGVLRSCSEALGAPGVRIDVADFSLVSARAKPNDLVYFDPPYVASHSDNGFRAYNEKLFSWKDQIRLAALAQQLAMQGTHVLVSNASHPSVSALYAGFSMYVVHRPSTLAADVRKRGTVAEAVYVSLNR